MSPQPMEFAKKLNLLDITTVAGKPVATVNRSRAHQFMVTQMGPQWHGNLANFPPHIIALFAIFAAKSFSDNFGLMSALDLAIDNCGALDIKDISTGKVLYNDARRLSGLRAVEVQVIEHGHVIAVYDVLDASRDEAIMSSYLTLFVMMLLSVGTYALSVDINRLVILKDQKY